jgi:hypothetical protein
MIYLRSWTVTITVAEFIPLKTECAGTFPHEHCRWRQPKPTSRSCSRTSRRRPAPHERRLRGITHIRCIDIVRASVQQSSRRRWIWLEIQQHDGVRNRRFSFNPRTQFQTWKPSQEEERKRREWMSQGPQGVYIVGREGRWPPALEKP